MNIELGLGQEEGKIDLNRSNVVNLRHAYGWWHVIPGFRVMAGKSTTPLFTPESFTNAGNPIWKVPIYGV